MRAFVEVLGAGTPDAGSSVLLFFDDARYMFECGDGTQRYCTERSVRLGRLRGLFLSSLEATSVGGLLGMVLTIADAGKEKVSIVGPTGVSKVFDFARTCGFCHRPAMDTTLIDVEAPKVMPGDSVDAVHATASKVATVLEDTNVTIRAIPIPASCPGAELKPCGATGTYSVLSYACVLRDIAGKFNAKRALELGVQKGPDFGRLTKGESVTTPDGRTVTPAEVICPAQPGPVVLMVSCPSVEHIHAVVSSPALCPKALGVVSDVESSREQATTGLRKCVVFHRAPPHVLSSAAYSAWTRGFGRDTQHIVLHRTMAPERIVFAAQAADLRLLGAYDGKRFSPPSTATSTDSPTKPNGEGDHEAPTIAQLNAEAHQRITEALSDRSSQSSSPSTSATAHAPSNTEGSWCAADCGLQYILAPSASAGLSTAEMTSRSPKPHTPFHNFGEDHWRKIAATDPLYANLQCSGNDSPRYSRTTAELCFLGTGGAIPGKHRNVSSTLVNMFSRGCMMFDCGEGTWGQLVRAYGKAEATRLLCSLRVLFISHMHADHHLGTLTLLQMRREALRGSEPDGGQPELVVIGPWQMRAWLFSFDEAVYGSARPRDYNFWDASALTEPQDLQTKFFSDSFGLDIGCVDVVHCPNSYGIVATDVINGWKVVYSGDTRPCQALAVAGKSATVAIHEATLDDSMRDEALAKNHSTTSEALEVCSTWMSAWRTVLTHFSQRYPRVPLLDNDVMTKLANAGAIVAFDLMRVNFADLDALPLVMPSICAAFPEECTARHVCTK